MANTKRTTKITLLAALILSAVAMIAFQTRAFLPTAGSYATRLQLLKGWSSQGYYGFNCSGFLSRAHGEAYRSEQAMFRGGNGLTIVSDLDSRNQIDESKLQPGDIAAFGGPQGIGLHVAAYLGQGIWIDSDSRRGQVATYRLQSKSISDTWFQGRVHIVRWNSKPRTTLTVHFFDNEQTAIMNMV